MGSGGGRGHRLARDGSSSGRRGAVAPRARGTVFRLRQRDPARSPRDEDEMAESRTGATSAAQIDTPAAREGGFSLRTTVFGADELRRAQTRIAHEIVERNHGAGEVVLVGLHLRGPQIAQRLAETIESFEAVRVPVGALDVEFYRDDIGLRRVQP